MRTASLKSIICNFIRFFSSPLRKCKRQEAIGHCGGKIADVAGEDCPERAFRRKLTKSRKRTGETIREIF